MASSSQKWGVDDYLAAGHALDELVVMPAADWLDGQEKRAETIELLDAAPLALNRPLDLVEGHAYATTWLYYTSHIRSVTTDLDVSTETKRDKFVMRDDGGSYGPGLERRLTELPLTINQPEPPQPGREWSKAGFVAYRDGERPDPFTVFARLALVYDRFIDFERAFASQEGMGEMMACFSLATWFAPAFTVLGYPWFTSETPGSGKTQAGICWELTSYLGQYLTAGGSFAALRELANYGATLLFDDAEQIGDKNFDPDKAALFLAGNHKGATIPIRERVGEQWITKHVNAYCPRGFTAMRIPTRALESRSIKITLIRTGDARKGNADPIDTAQWDDPAILGFGHRELQDDCWALALWLLPEAEGVWRELNQEMGVFGREFEPWRALVAVARLLERHGIGGLEERIRAVMAAYQQSKDEDDTSPDWATLVLKAMLRRVLGQPADPCRFSSAELCEVIETVAEEEEISTVNDRGNSWVSTINVGRVLGRLRFHRERDTEKRRSGRQWVVGKEEIALRAKTYGIAFSNSLWPSYSQIHLPSDAGDALLTPEEDEARHE